MYSSVHVYCVSKESSMVRAGYETEKKTPQPFLIASRSPNGLISFCFGSPIGSLERKPSNKESESVFQYRKKDYSMYQKIGRTCTVSTKVLFVSEESYMVRAGNNFSLNERIDGQTTLFFRYLSLTLLPLSNNKINISK